LTDYVIDNFCVIIDLAELISSRAAKKLLNALLIKVMDFVLILKTTCENEEVDL